MLILSRHRDESIVVNDNIKITVIEIKGDLVKIGIKAPDEVKIYRLEVYEAIAAENRAAASPGRLDLHNGDTFKTPSVEF